MGKVRFSKVTYLQLQIIRNTARAGFINPLD